ncbi:MAG: hypothetical protein ACRC0V_12150, partial [Fusobacteriaceae bacterium]
MEFIKNENGFKIKLDGVDLIEHTLNSPFLYVGTGEAEYDMYRGNFKITDRLEERIGLRNFEIKTQTPEKIEIDMYNHDQLKVSLEVKYEFEQLKIEFKNKSEEINRVWIRVVADKEEKIYGCGEQMTHFNLRGKNFPLWTSEPGVGRNKNTYVTWQADVLDKAGGDYYTTNYPEPTFVSTRKYFCHLESTAYLDFDFRNEAYH